MDHSFDNQHTNIAHDAYYEHSHVVDFSSSYSPELAPDIFSYNSPEMAVYQPTAANWGPFDIDNIEHFIEDQPQLPAPGSTTSSTESDKGGRDGTKLRRRAQNRASQRAFRERKDRHLKGLEYQLEALNEKHQDLLQSYMRQSESVVKLNSRVAELRTQIQTLKAHPSPSTVAHTSNKAEQRIDEFDAFSFTSPDVSLDERDNGFWQDIPKANGTGTDENDLPGFEDLLQLN